jgi:hypothetical protein
MNLFLNSWKIPNPSDREIRFFEDRAHQEFLIACAPAFGGFFLWCGGIDVVRKPSESWNGFHLVPLKEFAVNRGG